MDEKTKRESDQAGARWVEIAWDRMEWVPTRRRNNLIYRRTHDYTPLSPPPLSLKRSDKSCQYQARINKSCRFLRLSSSPPFCFISRSLSWNSWTDRIRSSIIHRSIERRKRNARVSLRYVIVISRIDIGELIDQKVFWKTFTREEKGHKWPRVYGSR